MTVGFTGTRDGMSRWQASQLQYILALFYHADRRIGLVPTLLYGTHESVELKSDAEAAKLATALGYAVRPYHAKRGEELDRDRRQVGDSNVLVAAPITDLEERRSGTWATVRYARELRIPVVMLSRGVDDLLSEERSRALTVNGDSTSRTD